MIRISWKFRVNGNLICEKHAGLFKNKYLSNDQFDPNRYESIFLYYQINLSYFYNNENVGTFRNVLFSFSRTQPVKGEFRLLCRRWKRQMIMLHLVLLPCIYIQPIRPLCSPLLIHYSYVQY